MTLQHVQVKARIFPLIYGLLIGGGMSLCLVASLWLHYEKVLKNHCRVWEYWPSVSSVIGDYSPQKNIWRMSIGLGSGPRFITTFLNYRLLQDELVSENPSWSRTVKLAIFVDVVRIFAAGGWTYISSSEYLLYHEICFVLYVVFSFLWCGVHTYLFKKARVNATTKRHPNADISYRVKLMCVLGQFACFFVSLYFFRDHRFYCTPGGTRYSIISNSAAYSHYAVCEWVLSACNILYDTSSWFDFNDVAFTVVPVQNDQKEK